MSLDPDTGYKEFPLHTFGAASLSHKAGEPSGNAFEIFEIGCSILLSQMTFFVPNYQGIRNHTRCYHDRGQPEQLRKECGAGEYQGVSDVDRVSHECIWSGGSQDLVLLQTVMEMHLRPDP